MLHTLEGVLGDVGGRTPLETIMAEYAFKEWIRMAWGMQGLELLKKPADLTPMDTLSLIQSAQWYGLRTGIQALSRNWRSHERILPRQPGIQPGKLRK